LIRPWSAGRLDLLNLYEADPLVGPRTET
jgi:hypothetical protein